MTELLIGKSNDPGRRDYNEDRVDVRTFQSAGRLNLTVAVVADGVGGEERGEAAAQKAVDTVFDVMRASKETDVPTMLEQAVTEANQRVHQINQRFARGACTLSIAVVHRLTDKESKLYVANVGDSRVYLCRQATEKKPAKLTQLTLDHSFANLMPIMGRLSKEAAAANPRAENIMRAIGPNPQVPIDLGFYVNTEDMQVANQRGRQGLPIKDGDSIVVCSDGLIKLGEDGQPYCRDNEIIETVNRLEGDKAAKTLVSIALGRDTDDNVSAAVIQMPNVARTKAAARSARRPYVQSAVGAIGLITLASILGWFLLNRSRTENQQALAENQQALYAQETEIAKTEMEQQARETAQAEEAAALESERNAFATESAKANAERSVSVQETVSAMAALNETACRDQNDYDFDVGRITFKPRLGETHIEGEQFSQDLEAQWTVVNEGCPATNVRLVSTDGDREFIPTFINSTGDGQGNAIFEGEDVVMTVKLDSIDDANSVDEALLFVVQDPDGRDLQLNNVNIVELKVPNDETWIVVVTPKPTVTSVAIVDDPTTQVAAVPQNTPRPTNTPFPTRTPNYSATQTRDKAVQNNNVTATARIANATRTAQANQVTNNQTRDAFNQQAAATVSTELTQNAQQVNIRNFQATQTRQAEQNARNFQATQTKQAQNAHATQTRQAQIGAGIATQTRQAQIQQATVNASNAHATQTRQAQINAENSQATQNARNAQATQTRQAQINAENIQATQNAQNAQATQTRQAQINNANATATRQEQIQEATRNAPTSTPRPTNAPVPAPIQPTTPPQSTVVTPTITDTSCVEGGNGFVNGTLRWTGQLGANQWFAIRFAPQGQDPQVTGEFKKNNITTEGQNGNNWALTGFSTGLPPGNYSWTVALLDNGNPIAFAPQAGCFANTTFTNGGGDSEISPQPTDTPRACREGC